MASNTRFYKLTSRLLSIMLVKLLILKVSKSESFSINENLSSNSHLSSRININSTLQSTIGLQNYSNHRMDAETSKPDRNLTLNIDREAAGSVLRPQLALQIYTNPTIDDKQVSKPRESTGAMLIVPMHQARNMADSHQVSSSQNRQQHTRSSSLSKVNPWHYVTDHSPQAFEDTNNHGDSTAITPLLQRSNHGPPLINAIITVPTPNEYHHHHHHPQQQQPELYNHLRFEKHQHSSRGVHSQDDSNPHNMSSIERSVSRLMDSQADGSLEFTMNLNGEQITINPVSNKAKILNMINKDKGSTDEQLDQVVDNDDSVARRFMNEAGLATKESQQLDKHNTNRAIRTHIDSELVGDQQSASEIDLVDGANDEDDSNSSIDFDRPAAKEDDKTRPLREGSDNADSPEREERTNERRYWRTIVDSNQIDDNERGGTSTSDEPPVDETHNNGNKVVVSQSRGRKGFNVNDDEKPKNSKYASSTGKTGKGYPTRSQVINQSASSQRKATSSSKRRATFKDDDDNQEERTVVSSSRREKNQEVPAVLIKGEDVRRFEQLLENLRSISSLNSQSKTKRTGKAVKASQQVVQRNQHSTSNEQSDDEEPGYGNQKNADSPSTSVVSNNKNWIINGLPSKSSSSLRNQASSKMSSLSDSDESTDCDRRRQQQQLQRAATANNEDIATNYALPETSSTNIGVDQDPITSSDGDDLAGDDAAGQAGEQEEQSSNNHNKISLPLAEPTKDLVEASSQALQTQPQPQQPQQSSLNQSPQQLSSQQDEGGHEKPKALVARKTILQNYYDNNGNQVSVQPADDLKSIHKSQHETLHERHMATEQSNPGASNRLPNASKYPQQSNSEPQNSENSQASYIDYNQLDDREVHKGSESRKVRTFIKPKKQMLLLTTRPLHTLLGRSIERPRVKFIQV